MSLILRAQNAGEALDPELKNLTSLDQRQEYDRYAALIIAANHELGTTVRGLEIVAADLEARLFDVELLESAAVLVAEQEGTASPPRAVRHWRRLKQIETGTFLASVAGDIRRQLQDQVDFRWQEMRALEIVWAEIADRFDGEDARHPDLRTSATEVANHLQELGRRVARRGRRLPAPSDETLADMRNRVEDAFAHFNLRVTRP